MTALACAREPRESRTCRARATSNQAFVDVIIACKRAPSHRVFVAQVFGRNMRGKRRRRHRFSAFWLRWGSYLYRFPSLTLCQQDILQRLALFSVREHCAIDQVRQQLE